MAAENDPYYSRPEVSNSDLSWLDDQLSGRDQRDATEAYLDGSLLDAMITEQHRVNYFKRTLDGQPFKKARFDTIVAMKQACWQDEFFKMIIVGADTQKITVVKDKEFEYEGYRFKVDIRCKWDIWRPDWGWGSDIKSTAAKTQKEFEAACYHFNYDRQRYFYMRAEESERDVLIGISKIKPHRVFKVFINRNCDFYRSGEKKALELLFRWNSMFGKNKDYVQRI
ncbi:MAG: PD-(D/E)XK nuclease-like domain-containing protein [Bacteroidales bacterium]|nr:PD-(D/E)XK nuclease-like domain-containing protein [Bacteroidales bacterium]